MSTVMRHPFSRHRLRRTALAAAGACALAGAITGPASALTVPVAIPGQSFDPGSVTVVAGDTVTWTNDTFMAHTVTANDGSFASAPLLAHLTFSNTFTTAGPHPYHCTLHRFMQGEVDVVPALLRAAAPEVGPGGSVALSGRVAAGTPTAAIEAAPAGSDAFAPLASVPAAPDGTFATTVAPAQSTSYRVAAAAGASPAVTVEVQRAAKIAVTRRIARRRAQLRVHVVPARPGAAVVLQLYDKWRFDWIPYARARLDRNSRATFTVPAARRARARVVLASPAGEQASAALPTWGPAAPMPHMPMH